MIPSPKGQTLTIEVLHMVKGLDCKELKKTSQLWGFDFSAIWPMVELEKMEDGKIARWMEHRFP